MDDIGGSPWGAGVESGRSADPVTLLDGSCFVVCGRSGEIGEHATNGLFVSDTRLVSHWRIDLDGWAVEPLSYVPDLPFSGTFVSQAQHPARPHDPVAIVQRRHVGRGMRDEIEIRNHGTDCRLTVRLRIATDLAGLFDVKSGRAVGMVRVGAVADERGLRFVAADDAATVSAVAVGASPSPDRVDADSGHLEWDLELAAGEVWAVEVDVGAVVDDTAVQPDRQHDEPGHEAISVQRFRRWQETSPQFGSGHVGLDQAIAQSIDDLGALRIFDGDDAERAVVAAGAPWFMTLFGRDSLLVAWMAVPFHPELAEGVLAALAAQQGTRVDERSEEQPGRILHEVRLDRTSAGVLGGSGTYYGTVDATPLFVMLVAELARWTGVTDRITGLMPAVDRAIEWIETYGDRDGDGFVEYLRSNPAGLRNQGWKDSWDGVRHPDGSLAEPPIALCEVQGYVYAAYRGRAALARALGEDDGVARRYDARADALSERFDESFWLDDVGCYAIGLDEHKTAVRSITSNVGHLLWCGIVPDGRAEQVADRLMSPGMFTGWGLRTLTATCDGYNPLSYHCGSVWPHDTALAVAGLSRYGLDSESQTLSLALVDAAVEMDGRLPEVFGGFDRDDIASPVPYPTSCSPQAWSAASPLLLVRAMLGLEPDVPGGRLALRPRVPPAIGQVTLRGVPVGGRRIDIEVGAGSTTVRGTDLDVRIA